MPTATPARPAWVIAHRGASAWLPEHTLAAYARAIADGADAIEPDLVMTRDGVLVARHENAIGGTTDVAQRPEFAARRSRREIDGVWVEDWFTEDFSLVELRTLRARERLPALRSTAHDGLYGIPTFDEIVALAAAESARRGRVIGLVPELKHPSHFAASGLALEPALLRALAAHPYTRQAPVLVQSFETANLRALREQLPRGGAVRLLQLVGAPTAAPRDAVLAGRATTYADLLTPDGLRAVAAYADVLGPPSALLQCEPCGAGHRSALVEAAHAAGLQVMPWTFRPENVFLPPRWRNGDAPEIRNDAGALAELDAALSTGIDGFFADDPALGRRAVDARPAR